MAEKNYVTVIAIDGTKDGQRHEYAPGDIIAIESGTKDESRLLAAEAIREPSEAEEALYEKRQNAMARTSAPVKNQTQPLKPNGPGGASGESENAGGGGSVASDTNTVGAGSAGDKDSSQLQGTEVNSTSGQTAEDLPDAEAVEARKKADAKATADAKKTTAKSKKKDDLA